MSVRRENLTIIEGKNSYDTNEVNLTSIQLQASYSEDK